MHSQHTLPFCLLNDVTHTLWVMSPSSIYGTMTHIRPIKSAIMPTSVLHRTWKSRWFLIYSSSAPIRCGVINCYKIQGLRNRLAQMKCSVYFVGETPYRERHGSMRDQKWSVTGGCVLGSTWRRPGTKKNKMACQDKGYYAPL